MLLFKLKGIFFLLHYWVTCFNNIALGIYEQLFYVFTVFIEVEQTSDQSMKVQLYCQLKEILLYATSDK